MQTQTNQEPNLWSLVTASKIVEDNKGFSQNDSILDSTLPLAAINESNCSICAAGLMAKVFNAKPNKNVLAIYKDHNKRVKANENGEYEGETPIKVNDKTIDYVQGIILLHNYFVDKGYFKKAKKIDENKRAKEALKGGDLGGPFTDMEPICHWHSIEDIDHIQHVVEDAIEEITGETIGYSAFGGGPWEASQTKVFTKIAEWFEPDLKPKSLH